jgi:hypothetical protein
LVAPVLAFAFVRDLEPDPRGFGTHEQLGLPACPTYGRFGVPCPACGVTTSVALVYRGRALQGLRNQPFGFLVAVGLPLFSLWVLIGHLRGRDRYRDLVDRPRASWIAWIATAVLAAWLWKIRAIR